MFKAAKSLMNAVFKPAKEQVRVPLGVPPQDLSYFDARQKEWKKRMKNHPLRNPDYDPEVKTISLTEFEHANLDPTTSRQVRRQMERLTKKAHRTHFDAHSKALLRSNQRIAKHEDPDTGLIKHSVEMINFIPLTHVNTGRYRAGYSTQSKAVAA